jgi:hypothetical protein
MSRSAHLSRRPTQLPPRTEPRATRASGRDPREPLFAAAELVFLRRLEELYAASFGAWEDFDPEAAA